jgi:DNA-binding SARP family transcriptional activator
MDLLWPEANRKAASNNLRTTLHATRKILDSIDSSRYLASQDDSLVLCPQGQLLVDVDAFEEAVAAARRSRDPAAFRAALDLYSGELLPEDRYEPWAEARREELRRIWLSLHLELDRVYEERGDYEGSIEVLQKAISKEPTNEEAHAHLMRLYALIGRRGDALGQYERLREVLSRELFAEPDASIQQLREDIAAGRFPSVQPTVVRAEEPSDAGKNNLPASRDSFVGRERELVEVKRTLSMTRLLTLTGAGGSGKTRLAVEVARDLVGAYSDGIWLVELAPLSEGELVAQEVAEALEVSERPGEPLTDTLVDVIGSKNLLVVLDNCEHLVEAAAQLVDVLLDSCPQLRVLATSREPLGVEGEVLWRVPPLSLTGDSCAGTEQPLPPHRAAQKA